jgi:Zn-dependent peptidase ImmA (M78 family)
MGFKCAIDTYSIINIYRIALGGGLQMARGAVIDVEPSLLEWAIKRANLAQEIYDEIPKLSQWITGEIQPTIKQLEKFARKTNTPFGYLFLEEPPIEELGIPQYRSFQDQEISDPSSELIDTIQIIQRRQDWLREYQISENGEKLDYVGSITVDADIKDVAIEIKNVLNLSDDWASECSTWESALRELHRVVDRSGIFVTVNSLVGNNTHRKLNVHEFRGFVLIDDYAPFIFVNGADTKAAQMFTFAHELAHIWLGKSAVFDLEQMLPANDRAERFCNAVAAEFLVPESELHKYWSDASHDDNPYEWLARIFRVSQLVIARRLLDLNYINKTNFIEFYNDFIETITNMNLQSGDRKSGGNFYNSSNFRIGIEFFSRIHCAVSEGKMLYRDAYQLTGLKAHSFSEYVSRSGLGR